MLKKFYVVTPVFNPFRFKSRVKLYNDFEKYVEDNIPTQLRTIEVALGERPFEVTTSCDSTDIQLRTHHEMWHKERMINLAIARLPADWEYVAWIDADVRFTRPDWAIETVHLLQHYDFIQMFDTAIDLSPAHEPLKIHHGYMSAYSKGKFSNRSHPYQTFHPGFAWAARRDALDKVGGLIDFGILGAGDRHMAQGLVGQVQTSYPDNVSDAYKDKLRVWQDMAVRHIKKNVGHMEGSLLHYWHGKKVDRGYLSRWQILSKNIYDPNLDIKCDTQGLYQYTDRNPELRYDIRRYFLSRNEDSIDVPTQERVIGNATDKPHKFHKHQGHKKGHGK